MYNYARHTYITYIICTSFCCFPKSREHAIPPCIGRIALAGIQIRHKQRLWEVSAVRGGDAHLTVEISDSVHVILGASQNEGLFFKSNMIRMVSTQPWRILAWIFSFKVAHSVFSFSSFLFHQKKPTRNWGFILRKAGGVWSLGIGWNTVSRSSPGHRWNLFEVCHWGFRPNRTLFVENLPPEVWWECSGFGFFLQWFCF